MSRRTFRIFICVIAAVLAVLIGANAAVGNEKTWDVSYQMANAKISWLQTYYPHP